MIFVSRKERDIKSRFILFLLLLGTHHYSDTLSDVSTIQYIVKQH